MSQRFDSGLLAGAYLFGNGGMGVLGSTVPSTGQHGAGYLYNDLAAEDMTKEVRGYITSFPTGTTLFFAYENSAFELAGPAGSYSFTYLLLVDGVAVDTAVVLVTIGAPTLALNADAYLIAPTTPMATVSVNAVVQRNYLTSVEADAIITLTVWGKEPAASGSWTTDPTLI